MSRKKKRKQSNDVKRTSALPLETASSATLPGGKRRARLFPVACSAAVVIASIAYFVLAPHEQPPLSKPTATESETKIAPAQAKFVDAKACIQCHQAEYNTWSGSHHQLAMQAANESTVLGDFNNAKFRYYGVESTFFKRDGKFMVHTDGPDGKRTDYEVKYTFGVWPLQQYLIGFPGGRYQALSIAWDSRPKSEGGQRWFHLYPHEKIDYKDPLHWTGLYQNWNMQCAECHTTNLHKGYDATSKTYNTTFSDINVSCEACHGPGSLHVEWENKAKTPPSPEYGEGLTVSLHSRWQEAWKFPDAKAKYAQRDKSANAAVMNICAACHARRSTIAEDGQAGAPLEDTHRLAMIAPPLYYPDGQQREEDYIWGSFLQSKMFQHGVTCTDCHDPHSEKLRAQGNALCTRCHNAEVFDTEKHHFHQASTKGALCVECHMPAKSYMLIDARRDHSIRVPRPDLSSSLGTPNACTACHADRKAEWAAAAMDKWYGADWRNRPQYGTTLNAADREGAKSLPALIDLAGKADSPAIVRAAAATLAQSQMRPEFQPAAERLLQDSNPEVRIAALGLLEQFDAAVRVRTCAASLSDPILGVRVEAARVLADIPDDQFPVDQRTARENATKEYLDSLELNSDWPIINVNLGNLYQRQGHIDKAIAAYERALSLDSHLIAAYVNLADAYRQQSRDDAGEQVLRQGLSVLPRAADLHYALGLLLVRKGDKKTGLKELATAMKLAPDSARYAYVYAIGLNSAGKQTEALTLLKATDARHPYDLDVLSALVSINREAGDTKAALIYAKKAAEALPDDPEVKRLVTELEKVN
ncbi:MAG TPA: tetratricopeptide repeat protein [Burkholderiales bacterium]|nr:tetratricopeptide repeat protein [Burkholderiales bacterium]